MAVEAVEDLEVDVEAAETAVATIATKRAILPVNALRYISDIVLMNLVFI